MKRSTFTIFIFCFVFTACGQNENKKEPPGIILEPAIKTEVEKHIEPSREFEMFEDKMQVYYNSGEIESYKDDKLIFSSRFLEHKIPFKSFYYWDADTLKIDGAFGLFGGTGFGIEIANNIARLYHMLSSDDFASYAYNEKDSMIFRLEVPCRDTKIILSEIPDSTKKDQIIYGYVEFKSDNFFSSNGSTEGEEILPREKLRDNMKLYFKSSKLGL